MDWIHGLVGRHGDELLWWQMCVRALLVFAFGVAALRLGGKRVRGRWGAMDIVLFVMIGSNLSRTLTGNAPLLPTLAATAVLIAVHAALSAAAMRWPSLGPLLKGRPAQLVRDGVVDEAVVRRNAIGGGDLEEAIRAAGKRSLDDVDEAWLERNGDISVIGR